MRILAQTRNRTIDDAVAKFLAAGLLALMLASCASSKPVELLTIDDLRNSRSNVESEFARGYPHSAGVSATNVARTFENGWGVDKNIPYAYAWYDIAERLFERPTRLNERGNIPWTSRSRNKKQETRLLMTYEEFESVFGRIEECRKSRYAACPGDEIMRPAN